MKEEKILIESGNAQTQHSIRGKKRKKKVIINEVVGRLKGSYWHRLTKKDIQGLIAVKITYGKLAEIIKQPSWCTYLNALEGIMGCWSLMVICRRKISHKFCDSCDFYK